MGLLRRFMESRGFDRLQPDTTTIVDAPRQGGAKVRALRSGDGTSLIVYSPKGEPFTVDRAVINGIRVRQSWFDPRYGVTYEFHTTDTRSLQTFTPPTSGRGQDWVLVLEAAK
jgi:hypothetical protein